MTDITRLFQAFLAPAIFVSATALLILSINVRLMGIVSRLRQYVHAKHDAAKNDRVHEAEAYTAQIHAIEQRAEMIRRCFLLVLISLAETIASCLLLGPGLYWKHAALAAVVIFVLAMIALLAGTAYYIREVTLALSSVHHERHLIRGPWTSAPRLRFEAIIRTEWSLGWLVIAQITLIWIIVRAKLSRFVRLALLVATISRSWRTLRTKSRTR